MIVPDAVPDPDVRTFAAAVVVLVLLFDAFVLLFDIDPAAELTRLIAEFMAFAA